jgi:predicted amidophosphoribosyltransferase
MAGYGYGAKEARYATRLGKQNREQVNLCGSCAAELPATELLCKDCKGTMGNDSSDDRVRIAGR